MDCLCQASRKYSRDLANRVFKRLDNRGLSAAWTQWQAFIRYDRYRSDMLKIQNEHGDEVAKLKQQIMEQELEKKKYSAIECFSVLLTDNLSARGKNGVIM